VSLRLDPELVSVRCMTCRSDRPVERAIEDGWKLCEGCELVICSTCIDAFAQDELQDCPSSYKGLAPHELAYVTIPMERILVFASLFLNDLDQDSLQYRMFYRDRIASSGVLADMGEEDEDVLAHRPSRVQEERWKNNRVVITCRRGDGKFVSWETLALE